MSNPNQPSAAPEGGDYAYTQAQLADMSPEMREGTLKAQAAGFDVVDGLPKGEPKQPEAPKLITEVPLTDEQREAFAAKRAADEAALAAEPVKHGGYTGVRMSQMPGAVDALGRPTGPIIRPPESPES